jgi:HNH endonuclease
MSKLRSLPTLEMLHSLLIYDEHSGRLTWKCRGNRRWDKRYGGATAGAIFTQKSGRQYCTISILGSQYYTHRVIWKMMTGNEPPAVLDHADNNGLNNRWTNLRAASIAENNVNSKLRVDSIVGIKGVRRSGSKSERYCARIRVANREVHLGSFETKEEAAAIRHQAAVRLYGAFARTA